MDSVGARGKSRNKDSTARDPRDTDFDPIVDACIKSFQGALESAVNSLNKRIDELTIRHLNEMTELRYQHTQQMENLKRELEAKHSQSLQDFKSSIEYTQGTVDDIKRELREEPHKTRPTDKEHELKLNAITNQLHQAEIKIDYLENQSRRNNLRFEGIEESQRESWQTTEKKVIHLVTSKLGLPAPDIERAHRIGKHNSGKPTTIIVKFQHFKDCEAIMTAAHQVRNKNFVIYQDHSARVMQKRQELRPQLQVARDQGHCAFIAYDPVHGSKLVKRPARHTLDDASASTPSGTTTGVPLATNQRSSHAHLDPNLTTPKAIDTDSTLRDPDPSHTSVTAANNAAQPNAQPSNQRAPDDNTDAAAEQDKH